MKEKAECFYHELKKSTLKVQQEKIVNVFILMSLYYYYSFLKVA